MDSKVILALCLSIVGNIINAWGMIFMKIGHERANAKRMNAALQKYLEIRETEEAEPRSPLSKSAEAGKQTKEGKSASLSADFLKESIWWAGMGIYGLGSMMHVTSLGFGPSALLNPMEGLTLVANALSAPVLLGERLTTVDIIGTVVIVIGITMVVIFGPHSETTNTMDELLDRFNWCSDVICDHAFVLWSVGVWGITIAAYTGAQYMEYINRRDDVNMDGSLKPRGATFLAMTYTNIKGVMGGFTMLFGKIMMEALDGAYFGRWETYLFIFVFIAFNFGMEYWRQKALNLFSTMYAVPLMQVSLVVMSVMTGGIFFSEFNNLETLDMIMFFSGVAIICIGVAILSMVSESRKLNEISPRTRLRAVFIAVRSIVAMKAMVLKKHQMLPGVEMDPRKQVSATFSGGYHQPRPTSPYGYGPVKAVSGHPTEIAKDGIRSPAKKNPLFASSKELDTAELETDGIDLVLFDDMALPDKIATDTIADKDEIAASITTPTSGDKVAISVNATHDVNAIAAELSASPHTTSPTHADDLDDDPDEPIWEKGSDSDDDDDEPIREK